jgi:ectoine hydroxylase-related dioxygenase (phytanoyl-CoA dioxygenase family)
MLGLSKAESSLYDDLGAQFYRDGYCVAPEVLSASEVQQVRTSLAARFDSDERGPADTKDELSTVVSRFREFAFLKSHPRYLAAVRAIVGDGPAVLLGDGEAQDSKFGGWHKDTSGQEGAGHTFHRNPDYVMVTACLYLQDNDEYGGGIDLIPGSHHERDNYMNPSLPRKLTRKVRSDAVEAENRKRGVVTVPSKAGDLVMFDLRIDHRATQPTACAVSEIPEEHRKLVIFLPFSPKNEYAEEYQRYVLSRTDYVRRDFPLTELKPAPTSSLR